MLKCSSCPTYFCGWCLDKVGEGHCGNQRHRDGVDPLQCCGWHAGHVHVSNCTHNITEDGNVFGTVELFRQAQGWRRQRLVGEFLEAEITTVHGRVRVLEECRQDIAALGIDVDEMVKEVRGAEERRERERREREG